MQDQKASSRSDSLTENLFHGIEIGIGRNKALFSTSLTSVHSGRSNYIKVSQDLSRAKIDSDSVNSSTDEAEEDNRRIDT